MRTHKFLFADLGCQTCFISIQICWLFHHDKTSVKSLHPGNRSSKRSMSKSKCPKTGWTQCPICFLRGIKLEGSTHHICQSCSILINHPGYKGRSATPTRSVHQSICGWWPYGLVLCQFFHQDSGLLQHRNPPQLLRNAPGMGLQT